MTIGTDSPVAQEVSAEVVSAVSAEAASAEVAQEEAGDNLELGMWN